MHQRKMGPLQVWTGTVLLTLCLAFCIASQEKETSTIDHELLVVTIATEENDGFRQFMKSAKKYGLDVKVFGMGQEWQGGTMESIGGGHKINILKESLKPYKHREDLILMFVDSKNMLMEKKMETVVPIT
ncbi:hypothetical protein RRG08_041579 [Elysia crispata]|uniref:PLOD1-3-like GT domain-containing protein n=1 Tax=Elysia crispata TaxID=231223 RepID=A0AAE1AYJ6_9GAST|nr:hypothetical protein RRG08_041579 [Elysia crispata]